MSRLGNNWYSRSNQGLFEVPKPIANLGIGVDAIPNFIKKSSVFDGNDLGMLGNIEALPTSQEVAIFVENNFSVKGVLSADDDMKIHLKAKEYLKTLILVGNFNSDPNYGQNNFLEFQIKKL